MTRAPALLATAALLAGCAHTTPKQAPAQGVGSASYRTIEGAGLAHYQLAMGQIAMGATPEAHDPPAYPEAMLATCPAQVDLPARVIVSEQGTVSEVRMDPPPAQRPFAEAVRRAVRGWRYTPLAITRWAADADGDSHPVDSETKPFSLDYVFTFRCEHGRASVSSAAAKPSP
ncbi:hypothetical protein [Fulvimonas yonginensis]|uniref:TonB C-terminal domain-containing protein n=1 Tax=Fulvimonas yonginensis TaxID=1495200 RepID=A0ABU8J7E9_9GAMM